METTAATEITEVIEVVEAVGMEQLLENTSLIASGVQLLSGFALFFVVVLLCYFCYKFFRIFF